MILKKMDFLLIGFVVIANVLGIITIFGGNENITSIFLKSFIWMILGILFMLVFYNINYQYLSTYAIHIYSICIFLLIITLIPGIGDKIKGARSWVRIGEIGFQTSELAKIGIAIFLTKYVTMPGVNLKTIRFIIIYFIIILIPFLLIVLQPDLGSGFLLILIGIFTSFIGGINLYILFSFISIGFSVIIIPLYLEYQKYIVIDNIYTYLKQQHYQIADAIKILKFEFWNFYESKKNILDISQLSQYKRWAVDIISDPKNSGVINSAIENSFNKNPSIIRNIFNNPYFILFSTIFNFALFIAFFILDFIQKKKIFKIITVTALTLFLLLPITYGLKNVLNLKSHQVIRLVSFANPYKFSRGAGYQLRHSLITLGSGNLTGKGFAQGDMTKGEVSFMPEWYNDFIFSAVGEQFGFLGCLFLIIILYGIIFRGIVIALNAKDKFGSLLAGNITILLAIQMYFNLIITIGFFPITGLNLPFVSYGGSNTIISYISIGILLNINKTRYVNV